MILKIISSILLIVSIALLFNLNSEQITSDIMRLITPNETLTDKAKNIRGNKKKHRLYRKLNSIKTALEVTGRPNQFAVVMCSSLVLFVSGVILSVLIDNLYLMPVVSVAFALLPFLFTSKILKSYESHISDELETTLSMITTSYVRNDDIVSSVRENISEINPPLKQVFMSFEGEATAISNNVKHALYNLKNKIDNDVFREWCDTLIQCQDDRTLKDNLHPIISKLSDVNHINSELKTMMAGARNEYLVMVALVVGNVPLLYVLNKDWFHALLFTTSGKIVCGICGAVILVTSMLMLKYIKPVEYKG